MAKMLKNFRRRGKLIVGILAGLCGLVCLACDLGIKLLTYDKIKTHIDQLANAPVALVLGTSKYVGGEENTYYRPRMQAAADLFLAGKVAGVLVSGDNSRLGYNEPVMMRRDLVEMGIPTEYITLDYAGFRTLDSIVRCKEVFQQTDIIVVSQNFHCERALFLARFFGLKAQGFVAADPPFWQRLKIRLRETLARVSAVMDVYVLNRKPKFLGPKVNVRLKES